MVGPNEHYLGQLLKIPLLCPPNDHIVYLEDYFTQTYVTDENLYTKDFKLKASTGNEHINMYPCYLLSITKNCDFMVEDVKQAQVHNKLRSSLQNVSTLFSTDHQTDKSSLPEL